MRWDSSTEEPFQSYHFERHEQMRFDSSPTGNNVEKSPLWALFLFFRASYHFGKYMVIGFRRIGKIRE